MLIQSLPAQTYRLNNVEHSIHFGLNEENTDPDPTPVMPSTPKQNMATNARILLWGGTVAICTFLGTLLGIPIGKGSAKDIQVENKALVEQAAASDNTADSLFQVVDFLKSELASGNAGINRLGQTMPEIHQATDDLYQLTDIFSDFVQDGIHTTNSENRVHNALPSTNSNPYHPQNNPRGRLPIVGQDYLPQVLGDANEAINGSSGLKGILDRLQEAGELPDTPAKIDELIKQEDF